MKITPTSLSITQLLSSTNEQYFIPAYQRRYSWHWKQLAELWDDVDILSESDSHLLGSIVCLTRLSFFQPRRFYASLLPCRQAVCLRLPPPCSGSL